MEQRPSQAHILIVDDQAAVARAIKAHLVLAGFQSTTTSNGRAALQAAGRVRPDLAILDVELPDMTGFELCRLLRQLSPDSPIPVIMLSGILNQPIDQLRGMAFGADLYLSKPIDGQELVENITRLLQPQV